MCSAPSLSMVSGTANLAAILLATFTVVSGLVAPRMPKPKKAEAKAPVRPERRHLDLVEPSPA